MNSCYTVLQIGLSHSSFRLLQICRFITRRFSSSFISNFFFFFLEMSCPHLKLIINYVIYLLERPSGRSASFTAVFTERLERQFNLHFTGVCKFTYVLCKIERNSFTSSDRPATYQTTFHGLLLYVGTCTASDARNRSRFLVSTASAACTVYI
jgi:hypothetical protein